MLPSSSNSPFPSSLHSPSIPSILHRSPSHSSDPKLSLYPPYPAAAAKAVAVTVLLPLLNHNSPLKTLSFFLFFLLLLPTGLHFPPHSTYHRHHQFSLSFLPCLSRSPTPPALFMLPASSALTALPIPDSLAPCLSFTAPPIAAATYSKFSPSRCLSPEQPPNTAPPLRHLPISPSVTATAA